MAYGLSMLLLMKVIMNNETLKSIMRGKLTSFESEL
jgi:hypothetical protein